MKYKIGDVLVTRNNKRWKILKINDYEYIVQSLDYLTVFHFRIKEFDSYDLTKEEPLN